MINIILDQLREDQPEMSASVTTKNKSPSLVNKKINKIMKMSTSTANVIM